MSSDSKYQKYRESRNANILAQLTAALRTDFQPWPTSERQFNMLFAIKDAEVRTQVWELACQYGDNSAGAIKLISWVLTMVGTPDVATETVVGTPDVATIAKVGTPGVTTSEQAMFDSLPRMSAEDLAKVVAPPTPKSLISKLEAGAKPAPMRLSAEELKACEEAGTIPGEF